MSNISLPKSVGFEASRVYPLCLQGRHHQKGLTFFTSVYYPFEVYNRDLSESVL